MTEARLNLRIEYLEKVLVAYRDRMREGDRLELDQYFKEYYPDQSLVFSPVFFGKWLLQSAEPKLDSQGFVGWKFMVPMFDELPIEKSPDDIYTTDQVYKIFKSQYNINL